MEEVLKVAGGGATAARVGQGRKFVQLLTASSYSDGVLKWIEGFDAACSLWVQTILSRACFAWPSAIW